MKYFIVYVTYDEGTTYEFLFKSRNGRILESQLKRYPYGTIYTNKFCIFTNNALSAYIREIDLNYFPHLSKKDFGIINENQCHDVSDLEI